MIETGSTHLRTHSCVPRHDRYRRPHPAIRFVQVQGLHLTSRSDQTDDVFERILVTLEVKLSSQTEWTDGDVGGDPQ